MQDRHVINYVMHAKHDAAHTVIPIVIIMSYMRSMMHPIYMMLCLYIHTVIPIFIITV